MSLCLSLVLQPARPQHPSLCQKGACDICVTQGRVLGIPILALPDTCHFSYSRQASPLSLQWEELPRRAKYSAPTCSLASQLIPLSSSMLVAAPPAKAQPQGNNGGPETYNASGFLCAPPGDRGPWQQSGGGGALPALLTPSLTSALALCAGPKKEREEGGGEKSRESERLEKVVETSGEDRQRERKTEKSKVRKRERETE